MLCAAHANGWLRLTGATSFDGTLTKSTDGGARQVDDAREDKLEWDGERGEETMEGEGFAHQENVQI